MTHPLKALASPRPEFGRKWVREETRGGEGFCHNNFDF